MNLFSEIIALPSKQHWRNRLPKYLQSKSFRRDVVWHSKSKCRYVYSTRRIVESIIKGGNTANLCSIDVSKAFDKVNHFGLYLKLIKRRIPVELLAVFENWLSGCFACVRWNGAWSQMFGVSFGVRQGSVLSPFLSRVSILTRDIDIANLSLCLFVCPLPSGTRWKRLNISS